MRSMNRPYGAVDVAANLKGAIPKAAVQKILVGLTEKGQLTQKPYGRPKCQSMRAITNFLPGKSTFFVINQSTIDSVPAFEVTALENEQKIVDEENKIFASDLKAAQSGISLYVLSAFDTNFSSTSELAKLKITPSDQDLKIQLGEAARTVESDNILLRRHAHLAQVSSLLERLGPLRSGASFVSEEDRTLLDTDWTKWRLEWVRRRKVFMTFWQLCTDALSPQDAATLADDLGIELDTTEHTALERTPLCLSVKSNPLKRKR
ncbi:hypothetical protein H0H93_011117 [Arthromyces matolae]|nr:hypothetical protein H0H93_011117 [Arthromyces matolae]